LGVEKLISSKMLVEGSNRRVLNVGKNYGAALAGLMADSRQLVLRARIEASNYKMQYGSNISTDTLANRVATYVFQCTLQGAIRPFGSSMILGGWDERKGYSMFCIQPDGTCLGYTGIAIGKAKSSAQNELEKLNLKDMSARDAVKEIAKVIYKVHDDIKDPEFEMELSWICDESKQQHQLVPKELREAAWANAKAANEEEEDFDDSE